MLSMTSLAAQNQFGTLLDTAQRQPVAVTRHGRPVAVAISYEDYQATTQTIPFHVATPKRRKSLLSPSAFCTASNSVNLDPANV